MPKRGWHPTEEARKKMSLSHMGNPGYWTGKKRPQMTGFKHPKWNENAGYGARHDWISYHYGKASKCDNPYCEYPRTDSKGRTLYAPKAFHWSNISGEYKRERSDWQMLCVSCHRIYDRKNIHGKGERFRKENP